MLLLSDAKKKNHWNDVGAHEMILIPQVQMNVPKIGTDGHNTFQFWHNDIYRIVYGVGCRV